MPSTVIPKRLHQSGFGISPSVTLPGGLKHYYQSLQQAERLMKQGVDESFAPGVRLDEWEDDGSERFDSLWNRLQETDLAHLGSLNEERQR